MSIARIVIVEDRKIERDTLERAARRFGQVDTVATLEEAQQTITRGATPHLVLSDLHLHDGNTPIEVATGIYQAVNLNVTRLVFMTSDLSDQALVDDIYKRFPSIRLVQKSAHHIGELLQHLREDQSGNLVDTMDAGSPDSTRRIKQVSDQAVDEFLQDLGYTRYTARREVDEYKKRQKQDESRKAQRSKLLWVLGTGVLLIVLTIVTNWFLDTVWTGLKGALAL